MSISTYAELQTAISNWMARGDVSAARIQEAISMAEARLNRELGEVLTDQTLTATLNSSEISVSAYTIAAPISMFRAEAGLDEVRLINMQNGSYPRSVVPGRPSAWSYVRSTQKIVFDRPCDAAYPFRLHFRQRFALSDSATTNWLLEFHPDVYLAASIMWSGLYTEDDAKAAKWAAVLEQGIPSINSYIADQTKGELQIDAALASIGGGGHYNIETDQ